MFSADRRILCAGTLAVIPPGLILCALLCRPELCVDAWNVPGFRGALPAERDRAVRLDRALESAHRALREKQAVASDLAEGRLTLPQAAARCRHLDRHSPGFNWDGFRRGMPGRTDEERHCHEAIEQVRATLPLGRTASEQLARRLEAELQAYLDAGTVQLPDADSPEDSATPCRDGRS